MQSIDVIDSHTEGEPTRIVIAGGPDLGAGSVADQLAVFRREFDWFRSAVVNEPRGNDAIVGAVLCKPRNPNAATGVIYFNNVGYLNMCVHGTIGLAVTLAHLKRIGPGRHIVETHVGDVIIDLATDGGVSVGNVPSYRHAKGVAVTLDHGVTIRGDVAWGGNWFFLVDLADNHGLMNGQVAARDIPALTDFCTKVRNALVEHKITGANGAEIDHIEVFGPPVRADADSKNFVMCPGDAYDRSPCGTGTSAKLACLFADGKLTPGDVWKQESIIGSMFRGSVRKDGEHVIPIISGDAFITAEARLLVDPRDPFRHGIRL